MEVNFEQTNTVPRENPLFRGVWRDGFNWDSPQHFIAGYRPLIRPALRPPGAGPARLRQEGGLQNCRRLEGNCLWGQGRARRTKSSLGAGPSP
jgi:hypothetical protein